MNLPLLKRIKQQGYKLLVNEPTHKTARLSDQVSIRVNENFLSNVILSVW